MANEVRIVVTAQDKTKGVFGGVKAGMKAVMTGAAALGGGIALAMLKASHAAREAAKVHAQTRAVVKSTGGAANITAKQMEGMASRISKLTGLDDELVLSGENVLATFTNIHNDMKHVNMIFDEATMAITDMSVALGQDMKSSAIQVGKALNDPVKGITALKRVGVTFNEEQIKTIKHLQKTGKTAQAQKIILAELKKEFGGSAEAQATWADKAKVAAGNIEESFGDLVNKTFAPLGKWFVEEGAPAIEDFMEKFEKSKELKSLVKTLSNEDLTGNLNDLIEAIPVLVHNLDVGIKKWQEFTRIVDKFENATGEESGGPLGGMVNAMDRGNKKIEDKLKELRSHLIGGVKRMWGEAVDSFKRNHSQIINGVKGWVGRVADWIGKLPGRAKSALNSLASKTGSEFEQAKDGAIKKARDMVNRVIDWFKSLPGKAKNALNSLASRVGGEVEQTKDRALSKVRDMVNRFIDRMQELVRKARSEAGKVKGAIVGRFSGARDWLMTAGRNVIRGLGDGLRLAFNAVKKWVGGIAKWIKDHKGPISLDRQLLHPAGKALMEGLLGGLKFGFKGVGDFVYKVGGKISDVISKIKSSMFAGVGGGFGKLASGGYRVLGRAMAAARGWTGAQWNALNALWTRESGWNPHARNPSSGAFGIPQALPASKMGALAVSGNAAAQIAWGLSYIRSRYGSPLAAWAHSQRTGWYKTGGYFDKPTVIGVGEAGPERLLSVGQTRSFERLVSVMERGGGRGTGNTYITVNVPNGFIGSQDQLKRMLVDLKRQGRLDVITR